MRNDLRKINIEDSTYCFFDDMINIKTLDPNKTKKMEKTYKNILTYYIGYVRVKDLSYATINSVYLLYLSINRINGCIEESNRNKYLMLVPTDEGTLKLKEELWNKIIGLVIGIQKRYNENCIKMKFSSGNDLLLKNFIT